MTDRADTIAAKIEAFIRTEVIPYEKDPRTGPHGPSDELVQELRDKARKAGVLTPHILLRWIASHAARDRNSPDQIRSLSIGAAGLQHDGAR